MFSLGGEYTNQSSSDKSKLRMFEHANPFRPLESSSPNVRPRYSFVAKDPNKPCTAEKPPPPRASKFPSDKEDTTEDIPLTEQEKKDQESKKRKKPDGPYVPAGRSARAPKQERTSEPVKRNNTTETKALMSLSARHGLRTWDAGSLRGRMGRMKVSIHQQDRLVSAVMTLNRLKRQAQLATALWIRHVLSDSGRVGTTEDLDDDMDVDDESDADDGSDGSDEDGGTSILDDVLFPQTPGNGGTLFWQGVLRFFHTGKSRSKLPAVRSLVKFSLEHKICEQPASGSSLALYHNRSIEQLAVQLDTEFANHYVGKLLILINAVHAFDPTLDPVVVEHFNSASSSIQRFLAINRQSTDCYQQRTKWSFLHCLDQATDMSY